MVGRIDLAQLIGHDDFKRKFLLRLNKHPSGVFLFYGPVSVGKRTAAFAAARGILCKKISEVGCECDSCQRFPLKHPDFLSVGNRVKVVDIDKILEFCHTVPFLSDSKVIVIDDAHEMTREAANRLLKLLEEPPLNYTFFLVSHSPQYIIPTIISRCIQYQFGSLSQEDFVTIIRTKLGFNEEQAGVLGWFASASLDIFKKAGECLKYRDIAIDFILSIKTRDLVDSLDIIDKIEKDDLSLFNDLIILVLNDLVLLKNDINQVVNVDCLEKLKKGIEHFEHKFLILMLGVFNQTKRYMYLNINLNLYMKNALIKSYFLM